MFNLKRNVLSGPNASAVAAGGAHTCALRTDGSVVCWGSNSNGQLGIGNNNDVGSSPNEMGDNLVAVDLGTGKFELGRRLNAFLSSFNSKKLAFSPYYFICLDRPHSCCSGCWRLPYMCAASRPAGSVLGRKCKWTNRDRNFQ